MSVIVMLLVYVGIPAAVFLCIVAAVILPGLSRRPRYRPGEAWGFEPVWYVPHPAALDADLQQLSRRADRPAITAASRPALTAGAGAAATEPDSGADEVPVATARGGAHGEW